MQMGLEKERPALKLRHEYKYAINYGDHSVLRQRFRALFSHDSHVGPDGEYLIRSLYFDNLKDKALMEKINGVDRREKFRIRCYNLDFSFIRLEKKIKVHNLCNKQSAVLSREETQAILEGDTEWMRDSGRPLLIELYSKMQGQLLRPQTIIDYYREPFVYPPGNVRLTLDRDIRSSLNRLDFFGPALPTLETGLTGHLLEVKYDAFLPEVVRRAVSLGNRRYAAFSKYAAGRRYC